MRGTLDLSSPLPSVAPAPSRAPDTDRAGGHDEGAFDELVALAARICGARSALLTALDPDSPQREPQILAWFALADDERAGIAALAAGIVVDGDVVTRVDLRCDPDWTAGDPIRTAGGPQARGMAFFAGIALTDPTGRRLGLLSVFDPEALSLTHRQTARLRLLARQLGAILAAPRLQQDLQRLTGAARQADDDQHARLTLRALGDGVITMDPAGRITFVNQLAEHLTGWPLADALGRPLAQVAALKDEDGQPWNMPEPGPSAGSSGFPASPLTARTLLVRRDGHEISIEGSFAPIVTDRRALAGTVLAFRNVTVARKVAAELTHQATHDPMTGLANRRALERRLAQVLETVEASGSAHALLYLDLDQFKAVNDTAGHLAGDELLCQLAQLLKQHLRETDTLARLGGDEFAVLLQHCDAGHAEMVAENLRSTVEQWRYVWKDATFEIGVSIGLVNIVDTSLSLTDILSRGDEACYVAKARGRNRVHVYQPDEQAQAQHHTELEWREEIKSALRQGRMFLCRQPIVPVDAAGPPGNGAPGKGSPGNDASAARAAPAHVEVLLRMRATNGAIVPPMAFLPAAERYRLMQVLDLWVIDSVLRHIAGDPADDTLYAINLSRASLQDDNLADFICAEFAGYGVAPARVCFEIAETVVVANLSRALAVVGRLRAFGCRFAIDGFGRSMASFAHLKQLQVDYLKIDGALVRGITHDPVQYAMVESINRIGQLMGMRTIAGAVEDESLLDVLRTIGVDHAQGFSVGRPHRLDPPASAPGRGATAG